MRDIENMKVINDQINNKPVTIFSLHPLMARVFNSSMDGQTLVFKYNSTNNSFIDNLTGSQWDFEGKCIEGPMKGKQLLRLSFDEGFWFEWAAFHHGTKIYS